MKQGICIDVGKSTVLEKEKLYYLFPNGSHHFYVSIFPNEKAHKGCYESKFFQIKEVEAWPEEPEAREVHLDPDKFYKADLIWRQPGYKNTKLQQYFIKPKHTHVYFYKDASFLDYQGSFPAYWFSNFEEVERSEPVIEIEPVVPEQETVFEQLSLFG